MARTGSWELGLTGQRPTAQMGSRALTRQGKSPSGASPVHPDARLGDTPLTRLSKRPSARLGKRVFALLGGRAITLLGKWVFGVLHGRPLRQSSEMRVESGPPGPSPISRPSFASQLVIQCGETGVAGEGARDAGPCPPSSRKPPCAEPRMGDQAHTPPDRRTPANTGALATF